MSKSILKNKIKYAPIIAALCAIADQALKYQIEQLLAFQQKIILVPDVISLEKVYNTGASFSILQSHTLFLSLISFVTIAGIAYFIIKKSHKLNAIDIIGLSLILGGAAGNLIDRFLQGHVIDFIRLEFINFPIFNLADIFINVGVIILLISMFSGKNEQ